MPLPNEGPSVHQKHKQEPCPEEQAAKMSLHFKTCVDNFGSRVLAAWSCSAFIKYLTPSEKKEYHRMQMEDEELKKDVAFEDPGQC